MHPSAHRNVGVPKHRAMVAYNPQLELRLEFERIAAHHAGRNAISARQHLDTRLRPLAAFLSLRDDHESRTTQGGKVCGMLLVPTYSKYVRHCSRRVVPEHRRDCIQ